MLPYMAKRDFADVIELRIVRCEIIQDYLGGPNLITSIFLRGRQEGQGEKKGDRTTEAEVKPMCCEDGGKRPQAKDSRRNLEGGKGKETASLIWLFISVLYYLLYNKAVNYVVLSYVSHSSKLSSPRVAGTPIYSWLVRAQVTTWDLWLGI